MACGSLADIREKLEVMGDFDYNFRHSVNGTGYLDTHLFHLPVYAENLPKVSKGNPKVLHNVKELQRKAAAVTPSTFNDEQGEHVFKIKRIVAKEMCHKLLNV